MSKNVKVKGGALLLGLLMLGLIERVILALALVQLISFLVERVVNVYAEKNIRLKLHKAFPKWSNLDKEDRIRFKRPLNFVWSKTKEFFSRDFEAVEETEEV